MYKIFTNKANNKKYKKMYKKIFKEFSLGPKSEYEVIFTEDSTFLNKIVIIADEIMCVFNIDVDNTENLD